MKAPPLPDPIYPDDPDEPETAAEHGYWHEEENRTMYDEQATWNHAHARAERS